MAVEEKSRVSGATQGPGARGVQGPLARPIGRLLRLAQVASPEDIIEMLSMSVAEIDGTDVVLYLVDYEQATLRPHPDVLPHGEQPTGVTVEGSMAGRAFLSSTPLAAQRDDGWHVWVPVRERAQRLGVLSMTLPHWDEDIEQYCVELGFAAAHLVQASERYTDLLHVLRRRKDMTLAAEMQWGLLPPLTFSAQGATIAGLLEPTYEVGGDCFDYSLNRGQLDLAVFDAMGHGLSSAVLASLVVGAYRNSRRGRESLRGLAEDVDEAVTQYAGGQSFVTALIARLNPADGRLQWISRGHPAPLHVRRGSTLPEAETRPGLPLGLGDMAADSSEVVETSLEPGDALLLYTDGVVDASTEDGEVFGEDRLRDVLERETASGREPAEVLRRLMRTASSWQDAQLRDDASLILVQWDGPAS